MAITIKCADCTFTRPNKVLSNWKWTAYVCSNSKSPYHKTCLNISPDGRSQHEVTWRGCKHGQPAERRSDI